MKRLGIYCLVVAAGGVLLVMLSPLHNTVLKICLLGSLAVCCAGILFLTWPYARCRFIFLSVLFFALMPFFLPEKAINSEELRRDYMEQLKDFEGAPYYWGEQERD